MFAQGVEAFGMVEFFVGGLAGIDVGVPEFKEAIKHPGEFGCWGASEPKFCIRATEGHCAATEGLDAALGLERAEFPPKTSLTCAAICFVVR